MKRNSWFVNYEDQRDLNFRKENFRVDDFKNKSVVDFGCNVGQLCRHANNLGAKYVLGVDYDEDAIKKARYLSKDYVNIDYLTDDIDNYMLYTNLPTFNTGMFFSVIGTKELNNRYGILSKLSSKVKDAMYIEGHHKVFRKEELLEAILNYTTFTNIEYLGETFDNQEFQKNNESRDIFRCSRELLTNETTLSKLADLISKRNKIIAIQGHGGVGKSTLKLQLMSYLNKNTVHKFDVNDNMKDQKGYFISHDKRYVF